MATDKDKDKQANANADDANADALIYGTITRISVAAIRKCPFLIMVPGHYREDGTCKCDDLEHRKYMIRHWSYKPRDFAGIPLRTPTKTPTTEGGR